MSKTISIQGVRGSFHDVVASKIWTDRKLIERSTFKEVFNDVKKGAADFGVVAIENSIAGAILENYDLLRKSELNVIGEYYLRIVHNLMALPGQKISDLKEAWSHPMALKQCQDFLEKNDHLKPVETDDTARSAAQVKEDQLMGIGAIASDLAAEIYGLEILAAGIETDPNNYTRFLIISPDKEQVQPETNLWKTSIYVETPHKPGALLEVLQIIQLFELNMTMLVSRPVIGKAWEYGFYIDFTHKEKDIKNAVEVLNKKCDYLQILGNYPADNPSNS